MSVHSDNSLPSIQFQDPKINSSKDGTTENQKATNSSPNLLNQSDLDPLCIDGVPDPLDEEPDIKYILPFIKFY